VVGIAVTMLDPVKKRDVRGLCLQGHVCLIEQISYQEPVPSKIDRIQRVNVKPAIYSVWWSLSLSNCDEVARFHATN